MNEILSQARFVFAPSISPSLVSFVYHSFGGGWTPIHNRILPSFLTFFSYLLSYFSSHVFFCKRRVSHAANGGSAVGGSPHAPRREAPLLRAPQRAVPVARGRWRCRRRRALYRWCFRARRHLPNSGAHEQSELLFIIFINFLIFTITTFILRHNFIANNASFF